MIQLPAYLSGFGSRSDKSVGLRFTTQELPGDTLAELQNLNQSYGWLLFRENKLLNEEIPDEDAPRDEFEKSPSKILFDRMFVYFKEKKVKGDFDSWRKKQLELIGQRYLDKLV